MRQAIMRPSNILAMVTILFGVLVWSGCSAPQTPEDETIYRVVNAQQHPSEEVMILDVDEITRGAHRNFERAIYQCTRQGDDLNCSRTCGGEFECPERRNIIRADRSTTARGGNLSSSVMEADMPRDPDEHRASDQDETDEAAASTDEVEEE